MKTLNITFTDAEYKKLKKARKEKYKDNDSPFTRSWHDFVMLLAKGSSVYRLLKGRGIKDDN